MAPHEIYNDSFVGIEAAWHRLGQPIARGTKAAEAMVLANQDNWDVRAIPLDMPGIDGQQLYVIVRNEKQEDGTVITRVASETLVEAHYAPISNELIFTGLQELLVGEALEVDAAGVLGRLGNRAFMTFTAGDRITLPGNEEYERFLVALAGHTGRHACRFIPTGIRVVCANTEQMAEANARVMLTIEHNVASLERFYQNAESARALLGLTHHWEQRMSMLMRGLQDTRFSTDQWARVAKRYAGEAAKDETKVKTTNRGLTTEWLMTAWADEKKRGADLDQGPSTLWTARQAVSTYAQHYARGGAIGRDRRAMNMAIGETPQMVRVLSSLVYEQATARGNVDKRTAELILS